MKLLKFSLTLILIYLVQVIVIARFAIFGVRADLLLIVSTLFAVTFGAEKGFMIGAVCGFIQDIFGGMFYINTISKGLLGFLVGTFKESVLGTEEAVALIAVFVATVTNFIFEIVLLFFFFGRPIASPGVLFSTLILACLYNSILTPVLYPLVRLSTQYLVAE